MQTVRSIESQEIGDWKANELSWLKLSHDVKGDVFHWQNIHPGGSLGITMCNYPATKRYNRRGTRRFGSGIQLKKFVRKMVVQMEIAGTYHERAKFYQMSDTTIL